MDHPVYITFLTFFFITRFVVFMLLKLSIRHCAINNIYSIRSLSLVMVHYLYSILIVYLYILDRLFGYIYKSAKNLTRRLVIEIKYCRINNCIYVTSIALACRLI